MLPDDLHGGYVFQHYKVNNLANPTHFRWARDYQFVGVVDRIDWLRASHRSRM